MVGSVVSAEINAQPTVSVLCPDPLISLSTISVCSLLYVNFHCQPPGPQRFSVGHPRAVGVHSVSLWERLEVPKAGSQWLMGVGGFRPFPLLKPHLHSRAPMESG